MKLLPFLTCCCLYVVPAQYCVAQDGHYAIDAILRPAVLYSFVGYNQKLTFQKQVTNIANETFVQCAIDNNNAISAYFPVLYNTLNRQFGLSDVRIRYIHVLKRNFTEHFVALQGGIQVNAPSGKWEKGLGSGRWLLQPFVTGIFHFGESISFNPGISYLRYTNYESKNRVAYASNGVGVQAYFCCRVKNQLYFSAAASFTCINTRGKSASYYGGNLGLFYMLKRFQVNTGWNSSIAANIHTPSVGVIFYFTTYRQIII